MNNMKALAMLAKNKEFFIDNYHKVKYFIEQKKEYLDVLEIIFICHEKQIPINEGNLLHAVNELSEGSKDVGYVVKKISTIDSSSFNDKMILSALEDDFIKRRTGKLNNDIETIINKGGLVNKSTVLSEVSTYIDDISVAFQDGVSLINAIDSYNENIDNRSNIIKSGFESIDVPLFGIHKKDTYVIAGDTGSGKTLTALQLAYMLSDNYKVGFYSIEMGVDELVERVFSMKIKTSVGNLKFNEEKHDKLKAVSERVRDYHIKNVKNLYIHDDLTTFIDIRASIVRNKYDIVFIDYWQLLDYDSEGQQKFGNRNNELAEISRTSKIFSKTHGIPIIWLAQLATKQVKQSAGYFPDKSHLRDSTSIANDVSSVMLLYRPEYYGIDKFNSVDTRNKAWIIYDKNRHGITSTIMCEFFGEQMQMYDIQEEINGFKKKVTKNT